MGAAGEGKSPGMHLQDDHLHVGHHHQASHRLRTTE